MLEEEQPPEQPPDITLPLAVVGYVGVVIVMGGSSVSSVNT